MLNSPSRAFSINLFKNILNENDYFSLDNVANQTTSQSFLIGRVLCRSLCFRSAYRHHHDKKSFSGCWAQLARAILNAAIEPKTLWSSSSTRSSLQGRVEAKDRNSKTRCDCFHREDATVAARETDKERKSRNRRLSKGPSNRHSSMRTSAPSSCCQTK